MNKIVLVTIAFTLLVLKSYAQNIPLGAVPMLYNGGFAGEGNVHRFNSGISFYRHPFFPKDHYFSNFNSFDMFIPKLATGIGVTVIRREASYGKDFLHVSKENNTFAILSLSPKISIKGKYTLAPFVNFILSDDQIIKGPVDSAYLYPSSRNYSLTERVGFLFNSRKLYIGVSVNSLHNAPTYVNEIHSPWRYISGTIGNTVYHDPAYKYRVNGLNSLLFQTGYTFQKTPASKFSFTPQLAIQFIRYAGRYGGTDAEVDFNLMFRYSKFLWSLNNNGLGLGFQGKFWSSRDLRVLLSQSYLFDKGQKLFSLNVRVTVLPRF